MEILEPELIEFANDPKNNIEMGECDTNAIKVFEKFGLEINSGEATYVKSSGEESENPHIWNVLKVTSDAGVEMVKIIDIINYKENVGGKYISHRNSYSISKEQLERTRRMTRELLNA